MIFHGPHAYVSPTDYLSSFNVPTWNYTAVSVDGPIELLLSMKEEQDSSSISSASMGL